MVPNSKKEQQPLSPLPVVLTVVRRVHLSHDRVGSTDLQSITRPRSRRLINAGWCLPPPRSRVHADRHSPMEHSSDRVMSPALSRGHQGRSMPLLPIAMVGNSSFIAAVLIRPSSIRSSRCVPRKSLQGFRRTRSCKFRCRVDLNKKKKKNEKRNTKNETKREC